MSGCCILGYTKTNTLSVVANNLLIGVLVKYFGDFRRESTNYLFRCPSCKSKDHKLAVCDDFEIDGSLLWHCWKCRVSGSSVNKLLRLTGSHIQHSDIESIKSSLTSSQLLKWDSVIKTITDTETVTDDSLVLPIGFVPLSDSRYSKQYSHVYTYLFSRGISIYDIVRYNIGFCPPGTPYGDRVIVPSYREDGNLNYFVGRTLDGSQIKYKVPFSRPQGVIFENMINWSLPVVLCEGVFDAIAIRYNAIPLLGKTITDDLKYQLIENGVKQVVVALDSDASREKLFLVESLLKMGITPNVLNLQEKDPADTGYTKMIHHIKYSQPITLIDLVEMKMTDARV